MRILVVEDDHKVAGFVEEGLREEGFDVDRARDGEEALARADAERYDLILLDYMLPRRSGLEVVTALRTGGSRVPILMLTARDAPEDLRTSLAAGANDFLGKPFRFEELLRRIRALVLQRA